MSNGLNDTGVQKSDELNALSLALSLEKVGDDLEWSMMRERGNLALSSLSMRVQSFANPSLSLPLIQSGLFSRMNEKDQGRSL